MTACVINAAELSQRKVYISERYVLETLRMPRMELNDVDASFGLSATQ